MVSGLEKRFLAPEGWQNAGFLNPSTGHNIHYGYVSPAAPLATIVCVGGLSEFSEKYFETAQDMAARGYAFWFMDWAYQGRSSRLNTHPQRRHSDGFESDLSDLHEFIHGHVMPKSDAAVPMVLLAHSTGGNIGLQYLARHQNVFKAAAFTSPLLGIYNFNTGLKIVAAFLKPFLPLISKSYIFGGKDWNERARKSDGADIFSHDALRDHIHKSWSQTDQALQVGSPTFGWLFRALDACKKAQDPALLSSIKIPVLIVMARDDRIVDNAAIRRAAHHIPRAQLIEIAGAHHEILMEKDDYRNQFLNAFDKMVKENMIAFEQTNTHHHTERENDMQGFDKNKDRISDRILFALELALEQHDLELAETLNSALEISMTRNTGGGEFVERRDYPKAVESLLNNLRALKGKA